MKRGSRPGSSNKRRLEIHLIHEISRHTTISGHDNPTAYITHNPALVDHGQGYAREIAKFWNCPDKGISRNLDKVMLP